MSVCDECPMRLFNDKHHNLKGIGNPYFGNCIVVPNVDYDAYKKGDMGFSKQVDIIKEIFNLSTGELDNLYIVPLIRCNENISCEINNDIYSRCLSYFANDLKKYDFKHIMLLGDAGRRFLNCDITENLFNVFLSKNNRFYSINYSPLIKYTNEDRFIDFSIHLKHWYYFITKNYFENIKIMKI